MKYSIQQYAQALYDALHETAEKDHEKIIDKFVDILKTNQDLAKYEQIIDTYERLDNEARGVLKANVTTAREVKLDKGVIDKLNELAGTKLEVEHKVDDSLIGGVVIRMDDTLIDASVKGQLGKLKKSLSQ